MSLWVALESVGERNHQGDCLAFDLNWWKCYCFVPWLQLDSKWWYSVHLSTQLLNTMPLMCGDMVPGLQYKEKKMLVPLRPMIHLCLKTFKAPRTSLSPSAIAVLLWMLAFCSKFIWEDWKKKWPSNLRVNTALVDDASWIPFQHPSWAAYNSF